MAEGEWAPEFPGQRPPFQPGNSVGRQVEEGNELSLQHGAYSPRKVDPLADEVLQAVLEDPSVPAYTKAPAYRLELLALCRAEARVQLLSEWLAARAGSDGVADPGAGRVRAASLELHRAEARAASARTRLGLTPAAAAKLSMHVAQGAQADAAAELTRMREEHERAQLEARRAAEAGGES